MAFSRRLGCFCYHPNSVSSRPSFLFTHKFLHYLPNPNPNPNCSFSFASSSSSPTNPRRNFSSPPNDRATMDASTPERLLSSPSLSLSPSRDFPFSDPGFEDVMAGYLFGKNKATQVAHSLWKRIVQKGDLLVDATCGNGHDTLAMLKLVADKSLCGGDGRVYAMDIQKTALDNTISLLDVSLNPDEKKLVQVFATCHSKMEEVVPRESSVRLVAFNLGYLPGGDKTLITKSETTILGLEAAQRILAPGGLISLVVYVGHPGGMEEFERVQAFASGLPVDDWICCKLQKLNRPLAPILVFIFKR